MKILETVKGISVLATSVGVSSIVSNAIKFVTPISSMNPIMKVCVCVGSFALSTMISDKTSSWTGEQIDIIADGIKNAIKEEDDNNGES